MKLFEGCLLCCDIDGTLLSNGVIPEENIEKIRFFAENGGVFALATGRSVGAVSFVTSKISDISFAVLGNGVMIYDYNREKIIFETRVPYSDYEVMYRMKEKFPEIGIEVHFRKNVGVYNKTLETDDHESYEGLPSVIYTKEQINEVSLNKVLFALNGKEDIPIVREYIETIPHVCNFLDTCAEVYGRNRYYLEQIPKGVSKAEGVKRLANILNIEKGNLFAIGDYFNDFEMLKLGDITAAPNGAPKEIKDIVSFVTKNAEDGAVADFIDYLTKIRRK